MKIKGRKGKISTLLNVRLFVAAPKGLPVEF